MKNKKNIKNFWLEDIAVLYKNNNYTKIIPTSNMSRNEQLNSITRFCIYYIILLLLTNKEDEWIKLPLSIILLVIILFFINKNDSERDEKTFEKMTNLKNEYSKEFDFKTKKNMEKLKLTYDENNDFSKSYCRRPTKDNPFINVTQDMLNKEDILPNGDDDFNDLDGDLSEEMKEKFNEDLIKDAKDLFGVKNSQRQFFSVPERGVPDTKKFANWLYKPSTNCKVDNECVPYEDLRYINIIR